MKKSFALFALLALATAGAAFAQSAGISSMATPTQAGRPQQSPDQIADRLTARLTKELTLTPDQATKVRAITLANTQDMMALRQKSTASGNRRGMMQELKAIKEKSDAQYRAVLTPEQFTKLQALQAERQQMRRERMQQSGSQAGLGDL